MVQVRVNSGGTWVTIIGGSAANPPPNIPPVANFTFTTNGLAVNLTNTSTDGDGTIQVSTWDFGDGTASSAPSTSHTYGASGTYNVTLTVTDDKGAQDTVSHTVTVSPVNQPPVANFTVSTNNLTATFSSAGSSDPDGTLASFLWEFGDGTTSSATNPVKTYAAAGSYLVVLTVTDNAGAATSTSRSVAVSNAPANQAPVANFTTSTSGLTVSTTSTSTDADGTIVGYDWQWNDTTSTSAVPTWDHIVVVIMENHASTQIIGSSNAPYINSLANTGVNFTQSFALTHPSQPNYFQIFSGSTQGVTTDGAVGPFTSPNLYTQVNAAGKTYKAYSEDLPSVGYTGLTSGNYVKKHAPWASFSNVPGTLHVPFTQWPTDYSTLPHISFVVPNLIHDMHDGTVNDGDTWLQQNLGAYANWAKANNSLLIITFDEDDNSANNHIATVAYGANMKPGAYSQTIDHYSVLGLLQDALGVPRLAGSVGKAAITAPWVQQTAYPDFPFVRATDYGVSTTASDNLTALNNAIAAAKAAGKPLYLSAGTYNYSARLIVDGVTIFGDGPAATELHGTTYGQHAIYLRGDKPAVHNLRVTGTSRSPRSSNREGNGIYVDAATNFTIRNVDIRNVDGAGIMGEWVTYGKVLNNQVQLTGADGIYFTESSSDVEIAYNKTIETGDDAIAMTTYGTKFVYNFDVHHNSCTGNYQSRVITVNGTSGGIKIHDNHIDGGTSGISITSVSAWSSGESNTGVEVYNNTIRNINQTLQNTGTIGGGALSFWNDTPNTDSGNSLHDNQIYNPGLYGIYAGGSSPLSASVSNSTFHMNNTANLFRSDNAQATITRTTITTGAVSAYPGDRIPSSVGNLDSTYQYRAPAGPTSSHTYAASGSKNITLVVTDDKGATGSVTKAVTVGAANQAPVATFTVSISNLVVNVNAAGSSDPDGNIASYQWTWGDNTANGSGSSASHTYSAAGTYTITLRVTDNLGLASTTTRSATVTNSTGGGTFTLGVTKPDGSNTGVGVIRPAPTQRHTSSDYTVTSSSPAVVRDLVIPGRIIMSANRSIEFENCEIRCEGTYSGEAIAVDSSSLTGTNVLKLSFCYVHNVGSETGTTRRNLTMMGVGRHNFYLYRTEVHNFQDDIRVNQTNAPGADVHVTIEGCYLHSCIVRTPDPLYRRDDQKTHSDVIQIEDGANIRIVGNFFEATNTRDAPNGATNVSFVTKSGSYWVPSSSGTPYNQCNVAIGIFIAGYTGARVSNILIDRNWLTGGETVVNGAHNASSGTLSNNIFGSANSATNPLNGTSSGGIYATSGGLTRTNNKWWDGRAVSGGG